MPTWPTCVSSQKESSPHVKLLIFITTFNCYDTIAYIDSDPLCYNYLASCSSIVVIPGKSIAYSVKNTYTKGARKHKLG